MTDTQMREHIFATVMAKVEEQNDERRKEALAEFMTVTRAGGDVTVDQLTDLIPPLVADLYRKWITMFADRLLETVDKKALRELCNGEVDNNAAMVLAYVMFLESARMEKQIDKDLKEYAAKMTGTDEMGDLAANYIRARMARIASESGGKTN